MMCRCDDVLHHGRRHLPVGDGAQSAVVPGADLHQRVHGAQALAAGAGDRSAATLTGVFTGADDGQDPGAGETVLEGLQHFTAARRHPARAQTDAHVDVGEGEDWALRGRSQ